MVFAGGAGSLLLTGSARAGGLQPNHLALADQATGEARGAAVFGCA